MSDLGIPQDAQPSDNFATIPDVPIQADSNRVTPVQIASGTSRGTQTVVGTDNSQITFGVVPSTTRLGVAQYDKNGRLIAELGQQADGSNSFKFFDANGVGIAQFGSDANNNIALKIAKPNIEVGTATNDQLVFNSSQDVFKIVKKIPVTIPAFTTSYNAGTNLTTGSTILTTAHSQNFIPIVDVYIQAQIFNFSNDTFITSSYIPLPISGNQILGGGYLFPGSGSNVYPGVYITFGVDATNVYIQVVFYQTGNSADTIVSIPGTIFLLQETAT